LLNDDAREAWARDNGRERRSDRDGTRDLGAPARADWARFTSGAETREWLDAVIEHIEIAPARLGRVFDPSRVSITWR
jgi:predicted NBD/HSP70 family sugar kinase